MSRYIATRAIRGANAIVMEAEHMLERALAEKGPDTPLAFPNTAYHLPVILGMTGREVSTIGDLPPVIEQAKGLLHPVPPDRRWTPYLGETLDSGMATLLAEETIMALRFAYGQQPAAGIAEHPRSKAEGTGPTGISTARSTTSSCVRGEFSSSTAACRVSTPSSAAPSRMRSPSRSCASCSGATS